MRTRNYLLIAACLGLIPNWIPGAFAQFGAEGPSGPIDIQAETQEFSGDAIIAKGNVRVNYKGSLIQAPQATLMRDAGGNPQKAIFQGHPRLTQGPNKIDADTLTFEVATSRIVAEGRSHSEVVSSNGEKPGQPGATAEGNQASLGASPKKEGPQKIITDADRQEYDKASGKFEATGHVKVVHGDIVVNSDKLQLVYGTDNKPEIAIFTGNVQANQGKNSTLADTMTYSLPTQHLQASGHVRSKVIQEKKPGAKKVSLFDSGGLPAAHASTSGAETADDYVTIVSDSQDYSKATGKMSASGNVRIYYQDMQGAGPNVVVVPNSEGKAERVVFNGRSQISQPGRKWIADHIEMSIATKKVFAQGNTKAFLIQKDGGGGPKMPGLNLQLAEQKQQDPRNPKGTRSISSVDSPK